MRGYLKETVKTVELILLRWATPLKRCVNETLTILTRFALRGSGLRFSGF
jgi:hypothetical protein